MSHFQRIFSLAAAAIAVGSLGVVPNASAQEATRVWTISEIIEERDNTSAVRKPRYCNGGVFKPCICAKYVSKRVQYRPSVKECGRKAAVILSGPKYMSAFSVVVRDYENKDRWPPEGLNGCTAYERDTLGLSKCSAFKVQKIIYVKNADGDAEVHCLGASGYSSLFARVSRITAKLSDVPGSNKDPLERLCLNGPDVPLN